MDPKLDTPITEGPALQTETLESLEAWVALGKPIDEWPGWTGPHGQS